MHGFLRCKPDSLSLCMTDNHDTKGIDTAVKPMATEDALRMMVSVLNPEELKKQLKVEQSRRELLHTFIKQNLTEGTDYGRIHIATRERCPRPWDCKDEKHFSKPCLFKPGAEKFCSLLQLRANFSADKETLEMVGNPSGLVAFRCELTQIPTGYTLAEGRGACSVDEKGGFVNTTVKIAEKRAHIDAVLRLGLSDSFTQDLEDMKEVPQPVMDEGASRKQLEDIRFFAFVKKADMKKIREYVKSEFSTTFEKVSKQQAEQVMAMLEKKYGKLENVEA